ncbi:MAG TPA: DUF1684 domain-containing protein [Candidatus Limnocylindria bacterium]
MSDRLRVPVAPQLALADWRRRVAEMYAAIRSGGGPPEERLAAYRASRQALFAHHPSSPVEPDARHAWGGLEHYPFDSSLRLSAPLEADPEAPSVGVPRSGGGLGIPFVRIGWVSFRLGQTGCRLAVYWLDEYAGGLFIPFRDATSGGETYGAGRYLWDSAKGADLGFDGDAIVLDFNYAYHPSCVYDPIWSCPLAPPENRLTVPVRGGERLPNAESA